MKRIEFIAPVESMRGNLGEKQTLVYAPNNNRAYDSIMDKVNPALNYEPRLIASKGRRNYFSVKTKSSVHLTQKAKTAMSLLGGVGAIYAALVSDKTAAVYVDTYACYQDAVDGGYTGTFRKWLYGRINYALKNKLAAIEITTRLHSSVINNPWIIGGSGAELDVPYPVIVKFFDILGQNKITFKLSTPDGTFDLFTQAGSSWVAYLKKNWNTLGLFLSESGLVYYPYQGQNLVIYDEDEIPVTPNGTIYSGVNYTT